MESNASCTCRTLHIQALQLAGPVSWQEQDLQSYLVVVD